MVNQKNFFDYLLLIGINKPYKIKCIEDESPKIQLRTLTGQESLLILKRMDFNLAFPFRHETFGNKPVF